MEREHRGGRAQLVLGWVVFGLLLLLPTNVLVSQIRDGPPGRFPPVDPDDIPQGIVDLCDDEDMATTLRRGSAETIRTRLGVDCRRGSTTVRYELDPIACDFTTGRLYRPDELRQALEDFYTDCEPEEISSDRMLAMLARLYDLCDQGDAREALGVDWRERRAAVGVRCGRDAPRGSLRYVVMTRSNRLPLYSAYDVQPPAPNPLYGADELALATRLVEARNAAVFDRYVARPSPQDYVPEAEELETGCASQGFKSIEPWAMESSTMTIDIDGDGRDDRFIVYRGEDPDERAFRLARLRVELADGAVVDFGDAESFDLNEITGLVGATDLDHDGAPEFWLYLAANSGTNFGFAVFEDCELKLVQAEDGLMAWVGAGQGAGSEQDVECTDIDGDGREEVVATEVKFEQAYEGPEGSFRSPEGWSYTAYRLAGDRLGVVATARGDDLDRRPQNVRWDGDCRYIAQPRFEEVPDLPDDSTCRDFRFQEDAQYYFLEFSGAPEDDPHGLDPDHDFVVCDHLPRRPTLDGR